MSSLEEKKFKIDSVNRIIDSRMEDWKEFSKSLEGLFKEMLEANKREKNPLLAVCGIVITILFSLVSLKLLELNALEYYLSWDIGIGIVIFAFYGFYNLSLTKSFIPVFSVINNSITNVQAHRIAFIASTYEIEKVDNELIDAHYLMTYLIDSSNKIRIRTEMNRLANKKTIGKIIKQELNRITKLWETGISQSVELYKKVKDEFEKESWKDYGLLIKEVKELSAISDSKTA